MIKSVSKNIHWILIAGAVIMVAGGYTVKSLIDGLKGVFDPNSKVDEQLNDAGATVSDTEARILAENLFDAMSSPGTNEEVIFLTFRKMKNRADYNKVYNAFGKRQYSFTWGNVGDPVTSHNQDLITWISSELSVADQDKLMSENPQLNIFTS